jgi:hypothetical protein
MLNWFRPVCPCDEAAKAWVERRLAWLCDEFTNHAFSGRDIVLPTPEFFPKGYDGSERSVRRLVKQVCEYMDVVPDFLKIKFFDTPQLLLVNEQGHGVPTGAAGTFEETESKFLIRLARSEFHDPIGLVGTIAHELAHARLLGERRISEGAYDHELVTDLTVVFFGLGIFMANSPRAWYGQFSTWPGTNLKKPEYMTAAMFAYALAHLAWHRGEQKPPWAKHLRWHPRANLKQGIRYLWKTADSEFVPWHVRAGLGP